MSAVATPETKVIEETETPVELTQDEMESPNYRYDLPGNRTDSTETDSTTAFADLDADDESSFASEEENNSEIPGDPRDPHQTQPPTAEQY